MEIKLLASDLDGTLVSGMTHISSRVKNAVQQAVEAGVQVVLATGREYKATANFARQINTNAPLICYQGALIKDPKTHEILQAEYIPADLCRRMIKFARKHQLPMQLYTPQTTYTEFPSALMREVFEQAKTPYVTVNNLLTVLDDPEQLPVKFLFIQPEAESEGVHQLVQEAFEPELTVVHTLGTIVEAVLPHVSKGHALRFLAQRLNIPMENVMAMGDHDNDVTMLRYAGLGVAMGNGSARAKEAADVVAPDVAADGAAWAIEKYILGNSHDATA